jgi:hypothetical protein
MPSWLSSFFSLSHEISSKTALPIFCATLLILFLPSEYAAVLGIDKFRDANRIWIGAFLILTVCALVSNGLWLVFRLAKPWIKQTIFIRAQRGVLHDLTNDEKAILRKFIIDGEAAVPAQYGSGPIELLENKQVVARTASVAIHHRTFMYIMHPWAREYLAKNRRLLD